MKVISTRLVISYVSPGTINYPCKYKISSNHAKYPEHAVIFYFHAKYKSQCLCISLDYRSSFTQTRH